MRETRWTVRNRLHVSVGERAERRVWGRRGRIRTCPGRRGLRFTRAKECGVWWKTWVVTSNLLKWIGMLDGRDNERDSIVRLFIFVFSS
jgi:hypothetical protein